MKITNTTEKALKGLTAGNYEKIHAFR